MNMNDNSFAGSDFRHELSTPSEGAAEMTQGSRPSRWPAILHDARARRLTVKQLAFEQGVSRGAVDMASARHGIRVARAWERSGDYARRKLAEHQAAQISNYDDVRFG